MNLKLIKILACTGLLTMSLTASAQGDKGIVIDKIIAKVDDYIVMKSELDKSYQEYLYRGQISLNDPKCQLLENLVINKLMVAKAEIDSVVVLDVQVELSLDQRLNYYIQQFGSEEKLEEYYNKTLEQFRSELFDQIKEQMIIQKMQGEIGAKVKTTPAEVEKFYKSIPRDSLPYFSTEVTVGQIVKKPTVNNGKKAEIKEMLSQIRQRILNGEKFGDLAMKYSQDPGSRAQGGSLGFFKRGELAPEFEATALSLKPGDISEPVETDFGIHIIQLVERRGNTFNSKHILIIPTPTIQDFEDTRDYLDSLRKVILNDSIKFQFAAKEYSDDQETSGNGGFFSDVNGDLKVSVEDIDPSLFFTLDTMKIGTTSIPLEFKMADGSDALRLIYYKDKTPPHQANMKQDYQKLKAATMANKRNQLLSKWFKEAQGDVYINIDEEFKYCKILVN